MLSQKDMDALKQIAKGVAGHFGSSCEVVIHELTEKSADNSIVAIELSLIHICKVRYPAAAVQQLQRSHELLSEFFGLNAIFIHPMERMQDRILGLPLFQIKQHLICRICKKTAV